MRRTVAAVAAAALVGVACDGSGDVARFQEDLDTQAQAQQNLRDRMAAVERRLDELQAPGNTEQALAALQERLGELEQTVADVAGRLDDERLAREDRDATLSAALSDLQETLVAVQARLEEQAAELRLLREDHDLLVDRFEEHVASEG